MKLFKKISIICLAILSVFSLSMFIACGGDDGKKGGNNTTSYEFLSYQQKEVSMIVGDEGYYVPYVDGSASSITIEYTSSNSSVASVDSRGKVVALGKGKTKITASYSTFKASFDLTVTHGDYLPFVNVENLASDNTLVVPKNVEYMLVNYVNFNGKKFTNATYTYAVADSSVVSIDQNTGIVKGLKVGQTDITVKASWDGVSDILSMSKTFKIVITSDVELFINGENTVISSEVLYNKELNTLNGKTPISKAFNVVAKDENGNNLTPSITSSNPEIVEYKDGEIISKGILTTEPVTIKISVPVDGTQYSLNVKVTVEKAVADFMIADGSDFNVVSFDTLTGNFVGGELTIDQIFGLENVQIVNAFQGRKELTVANNKIVDGVFGYAFGTPEETEIVVYSEDEGRRVRILPYVFEEATLNDPISTEYNYSIHDGVIFDENFIALSMEDIFGEGSILKYAYTKNSDGSARQLEVKDGRFIVNEDTIKEITKYELAIASDDIMVRFIADGYSLLIDEMEDFEYFNPDEAKISYAPSKWTIASDQMLWTGYYALACDIDARCDRDGDGVEDYRFMPWEGVPYISWHTGQPACADFGVYGADGWEPQPAEKWGINGRGLQGTFDGRGHKITNYNPTSGGLFQMINGGTVKNLAFTDVDFRNNKIINWFGLQMNSGSLLASVALYYAQFDNIYIEVPEDIGTKNIGSAGVLIGSIGRTVSIKNSIIVNHAVKTPTNGYGGSFASNGAVTGANMQNVYVISNFPLQYEPSEGVAAVWEASYVDGKPADRSVDKKYEDKETYPDDYFAYGNIVNGKFTNTSISATKFRGFVSGVRRYTSMAKFIEDGKANNFDFSTFNLDCWEMIDGFPVMRSTINPDRVMANVNGIPVTDTAIVSLSGENDIETPLDVTYDGLRYDIIDKVEVVEGQDNIEVTENNNLKGLVLGGTAKVKVTFTCIGETQSREFNVKVVPALETLAEEYYFSAGDGSFFTKNEQGQLVAISVKDILGSDTEVTLTNAFMSDGKALEIGEDNAVLGIKQDKREYITNEIILASDVRTVRFTIKTAGMIIDEAEDLSFFTIKEDFGWGTKFGTFSSTKYWFTEGDYAWTGYYILANDIDAYGYKHDIINGKQVEGSGLTHQSEQDGARLEYLADTGIAYAYNATHGLMGLFDGQGYTISNLTTDKNGLFGYCQSGTIQNVGFVNCTALTKETMTGLTEDVNSHGFLGFAILGFGATGNATMENVYIESTPGTAYNLYAPGFATVGLRVNLKNVVIVDNKVMATEGPQHFSMGYGSLSAKNTRNNGQSDGFYGVFENVYVISNNPLAVDVNNHQNKGAGDNFSWKKTPHFVTYDAEYIDGVLNEKQNTVIRNYDGKEHTFNQAIPGTKRFTSLQALNNDTTIKATLESIFTEDKGWTFEGNLPILLSSSKVDVYAAEVNNSALSNITALPNQQFMVNPIVNEQTAENYTVEITAGANLASIDATNDKLVKVNGDAEGTFEITVVVYNDDQTDSRTFKFVVEVIMPTLALGDKSFTDQDIDGRITVGTSKDVSVKCGVLDIDDFTVAVSDETVALVEGKTITGLAPTAAGVNATVTVTIFDIDYTFNLVVSDAPVEIDGIANEFYFSAINGEFFANVNGTLTKTDILEVLGVDTLDVSKIYDMYDNVLSYDSDNGTILGVTANKQDWEVQNILIITAENKVYNVTLNVADLIIDEATDLSAFMFQEDYTVGWVTDLYYGFQEGDFLMDGYYVLANNIDATDYYHDHGTNATEGAIYGLRVWGWDAGVYIERMGTFATRNWAHINGKAIFGLTGTFDGRGYTIANLTTNYDGLFGLVQGGTIKNVAFDNCSTKDDIIYGDIADSKNGYGFLAFSINGTKNSDNVMVNAKVENVFINTPETEANFAYSPAFYSIGRYVDLINFVTVDNTTLSSIEPPTKAYQGYGSLSANSIAPESTFWAFLGTERANVIVVSDKALSAIANYNIKVNNIDGGKVGTFAQGEWTDMSTHTTVYDAKIIDGVEVEDTNVIGVAGFEYLQTVSNVRRYTDISKVAEDTTLDVTGFSSDYWEIVNGLPTFKSLNQGYEVISAKLNDSINSHQGATYGEILVPTVYVDGVENTDFTVTLSNNSMATVNSDNSIKIAQTEGDLKVTLTKDNVKFEFVVTVIAPTFYIGEKEIAGSNIVLVEGSSEDIRIKVGDSDITDFTVTSQNTTNVSINGATISALSFVKETFDINVVLNGYTYTFVTKVSHNAIEASNYYYYSAIDGVLFNANFDVVTIEEIISAEFSVTATDVTVYSNQDEILDYDATNGTLSGVEVSGKDWTLTYIYVEIGESFFKINLSAAELIIDQATDLSVFKFQQPVTFNYDKITFVAGDFYMDGYYVLADDIDATGYYHDHKTNATAGSAETGFKRWGWEGGTFIETNGSATWGQIDGKAHYGLTGTFDGQGHTISNLTTDFDGLFGVVQGGTIKNVAFDNCGTKKTATSTASEEINAYGFLAASINGGGIYGGQTKFYSTVENVFINTPKAAVSYAYSPAFFAMGTCVNMTNFVIVDNTWLSDTVPTDTQYRGYGSLATNSMSSAGWASSFGNAKTNVIVVSDKALTVVVDYNRQLNNLRVDSALAQYVGGDWTDVSTHKAYFDAKYIDGVEIANTTIPCITGAYNITQQVTGVRRYTDMSKVASDANASTFTSALVATGYFTYTDGVIGWAK